MHAVSGLASTGAELLGEDARELPASHAAHHVDRRPAEKNDGRTSRDAGGSRTPAWIGVTAGAPTTPSISRGPSKSSRWPNASHRVASGRRVFVSSDRADDRRISFYPGRTLPGIGRLRKSFGVKRTGRVTRAEIGRRLRQARWPEPAAELRTRVLAASDRQSTSDVVGPRLVLAGLARRRRRRGRRGDRDFIVLPARGEFNPSRPDAAGRRGSASHR